MSRRAAVFQGNTVPRTNEFGQPIGQPLPQDWVAPPPPAFRDLQGARVRLERLDAKTHAADLFSPADMAADNPSWTYLPYGPFDSLEAYRGWVEGAAAQTDPQFFAILCQASGQAVGVCSFLRIDPAAGSIEIGHIWMSSSLQRTAMATEAMYLMMRAAFDLGYRRYEWKCDALNAPSQRAAQRLGFTYEGTFRQAAHYKGRNRDTAWYAITDQDWPICKQALEIWLEPENFDKAGHQRMSLDAIRKTMAGSGQPEQEE